MVDTAAAQADEDVDEEEEQEAERKYQRSVKNDDSPIYGNLSMDHKDDNMFHFLSVHRTVVILVADSDSRNQPFLLVRFGIVQIE